MTHAIIEFYKKLVTQDRNRPLKQLESQTTISQTSRISRLLVSYSQKKFTGSIDIDAPSGQQWSIQYRLGRMIWASGGSHPLRRWRRSLYQSHAVVDFQNLDRSALSSPHTPLEYQILSSAIEQKHLTRQQAKNVILQIVRDVIFDILQEESKYPLDYRLKSEDTAGNLSILLKSESVVWQVVRDWNVWSQSDLKEYSPNAAPKLRKAERFAQALSPTSYRRMENLMSGRHSLRDLAVILDRDMIAFSQSLMPYVRQGAIELIEIPDEPMEWIVSPS